MTASLVEYPSLGWEARFAYLTAKHEQKRTDLYAMDLVWLIARHYYNGLDDQPSEIFYRRKKKDTRSGKQIAADLIKGLGGE